MHFFRRRKPRGSNTDVRDTGPQNTALLDDTIDFIAEIDRAIHAGEIQDLEGLAQQIVHTMGTAVGCIGGALLLVDPAERVLRPFVHSSINVFVDRVIPLLSKPFRDYTFDLVQPKNLTARTAAEGRTFVGDDYVEFLAPTVSASVSRQIQRLVRMRTVVTAPAMLGDEVLGVLMVGFREAELSDFRRRLLELFAGQCAVAIHDARQARKIARLLEREQDFVLRLRSSDKLKSDLLLMAGHELRTPLAAVRYGLEAIRISQNTDAGSSQADLVDKLIGQISGLNALVDEMCETLQASDGRMEFIGKPVRVDSLLEGIVERRSAELIEAEAKVTFREPSDRTPLVVSGDEARLRYAFWEILTNAIKHGGPGVQVCVELRGESREANKGVRVTISNSGKGMDESTRVRVLNERLVTPSEIDHKSIPGMGIGLYLVNKIVELHKGTVEIDSAPGRDTSVAIWIPAV